jgi:hypothetical protein
MQLSGRRLADPETEAIQQENNHTSGGGQQDPEID